MKRKLTEGKRQRERERGRWRAKGRQLAEQSVESLKKLKVSKRQLQIKCSQQMSKKDHEDGNGKAEDDENEVCNGI